MNKRNLKKGEKKSISRIKGAEEYAKGIIEIKNNIKSFIKNFKSDVVKKKKNYTAYIQNLKNK